MAKTASHILTVFVALAIATLAFACPAYADADHSKAASASQMAASKALLLEGMQPITADMVNDGTYDIEAESTSPFFKIKGAKLTVADGKMTAVLDFDSKSYPLIYMGTAKQAAEAPYEDYIEFNGDAWTFTVPVEALDAEIDCAAWSKRRKQWYDRKLMFYAATLPADALKVELPEYGDPVDSTKAETAKTSADVASGAVHDDGYEAVAIDLPDGEYSIEVNMTGGSGRASVSSPTWLIVEDGHAYARLLWSSSYYDYMIVDEQRYENLTDDGSNSTFIIPITQMDEEIPVVADTTAMGDPVEIEYHLTFYSNTVDDKDAIPQEAAIKVLIIAIIVIVVGGILNHVLKKRKKR
ncbi:MAG: hypothetical protein IJ111_09665 [Eggerthellaceae bacterium]|nr:hypothetical protein [Eggerthellaceae bacterium]